MKVGIMQPYFFPYIGHFALIAHVDLWLVFDITQYTPKTWMNRNRILHPKAGWQYITIPLSNSSIRIKTWEARMLNTAEAKLNIVRKLHHYRKRAPYYDSVIGLINKVFDSARDDSLVSLDVSGLDAVCRYIGIPFNYRICSELNLLLSSQPTPGEWALELCSLVGATSYLNPESGRDLFDPRKFERRGINLYFARAKEYTYNTAPYQYERFLSIIDVMMWNAPKTILEAARNGMELTEAASASSSL